MLLSITFFISAMNFTTSLGVSTSLSFASSNTQKDCSFCGPASLTSTTLLLLSLSVDFFST